MPTALVFFVTSLLAATASPDATGASAAAIRLEPTSAKPGSAVLVTVTGVTATPEGKVGERPLHFYRVDGGFEALTALPVETAPGELAVDVATRAPSGESTPGNGTAHLAAKLTVLDPHFPARELTVAKQFIEPSRATKRRMRADQKAFKAAYALAFVPRQFRGPFIRPRDSQVTAPFGDLRTFNGKKQSQHYGMDLDGKVGDPVQAAQEGTVVLARECYASGNTLLVHHGARLFTAYFHLSKFLVKSGDKVKQGQEIGLVGKTGRVTGPHLHFASKIDGLYVDPQSLLDLSFTAEVEPAP